MTSAGKLPVWATVVGGLRLLAVDWRSLLAILWLPLALLVAADFLLAHIWERRLEGLIIETNPMLGPLNADAALLLALGGIGLALWHRVGLVGPGFLSIFGLLAAWRNIVTLALHWGCLVVIFVGVKSIVVIGAGTPMDDFLNWLMLERFDLIAWPVLFGLVFDLSSDAVFMLPALHIAGRLGLMLWALPTGDPAAPSQAWASGRGNGWRLALAIFLAILPIRVAASLARTGFPDFETPLALFLQWDIPAFLALFIAVSVIAAAHRYLCGEHPGQTAPTS